MCAGEIVRDLFFWLIRIEGGLCLEISGIFLLLEFLKLGRLVCFHCLLSLLPQGSTAITVLNIS